MMLAEAQEAVVVEQQIPPEQSVGSLKQGLVCLPAGTIKAFQLRMPSRDALETELKRQSIWPSDQKLWGVIRKIDVSLCTSWKGIAATKPKGKVTVEISWYQAPPEDAPDACVGNAQISLDGDDPRISEKPLITAIVASLVKARQCLGKAPTS